MAIIWDISPEIISIGPISLRWYGLLFGAAFLVGYYIGRWIYTREQKPLVHLDQLLFVLILGTVIGARLGHCLFYEPGYYLSRPLEILMIWRGGLASHGGALGILVAVLWYCRKHPDQPYLWLLDRIAIPTALGASFIRLGNLFNSEIIGTPTQLPWGFVFIKRGIFPRHPVQLYESLCYLLTFVILLWIYKKYGSQRKHGFLLGVFLILVFLSRFFLEFLKVRQAEFAQDYVLSVGQYLSIPMIAAGLALIIVPLWRQKTSSSTH